MKTSSCQLIVAGGGVAGTCAAIAAARCGIRTILVEREAYLGGTGYAGMFQYVCGLYLNGEQFPETTLNSGLPNEIALLLQKASPDGAVRKSGQLYLLPYRSSMLKDILTTLSKTEQYLTVLSESSVTSVAVDRGVIRSVTVHGPTGEQVLSSTMVIDCTGSGAVAALAGAGYELSPEDERQLAGFTVRVTGLAGSDDLLPIKVPYFCAQGVKQGGLPPLMRFTTFTQGDDASEGFCKLSLDGADGAERDDRAQKMAQELVVCLRCSLPAFKEARIDGASLKVLDREGRRITGAYTLTEDDILSARKFHDGIVKNAWPIELWDKAKGTVYSYLAPGDYYEIPLRCLMVKDMANLLTAGRCISVTHAALGSTRVMGTCMALGEQAGLAAVYHIRNGNYPETMV